MTDDLNDDLSARDDRIGADTLLEIVRVTAEFIVAGAVGGIVGEPANRKFQTLVRRVRRSERESGGSRSLTDAEALEWAIWLIESRYLDIVSAATKVPLYKVNRCRRTSDGRRWTIEVEYLRAGTFTIEFDDGEVGPLGDATVTWNPPTRAVRQPSAEPLGERDGIVSRRVEGLRARILFALPWIRNR